MKCLVDSTLYVSSENGKIYEEDFYNTKFHEIKGTSEIPIALTMTDSGIIAGTQNDDNTGAIYIKPSYADSFTLIGNWDKKM